MSTAARLRGLATASVTATLAVAAHAAAGGGLPSGGAVAELVVLATVIGAVAFTMRANTGALLGLLAAGQLLGHLLLGAVGHSHSQGGAPTSAMLAAHAAAVLIGALLIAVGEHLCAAVSRAVRVAASIPRELPCVLTTVTAGTADQPLFSELVLAASMSHRGPPVSPAL